MSRGRGKKDPVQLCRGSLVIIYRSPPQNSPPNEARHAETSALNTKGHGGWHWNCALHFNSSITPGNQSGRSTETLIGNAQMKPGCHRLGGQRILCCSTAASATRNPKPQDWDKVCTQEIWGSYLNPSFSLTLHFLHLSFFPTCLYK